VQNKTAILAGILDVGVLAAAILAARLALHGQVRIDAIGFICAGLNIIMYGSPLAAMVSIFLFCVLKVFLYINHFISHPKSHILSFQLK